MWLRAWKHPQKSHLWPINLKNQQNVQIFCYGHSKMDIRVVKLSPSCRGQGHSFPSCITVIRACGKFKIKQQRRQNDARPSTLYILLIETNRDFAFEYNFVFIVFFFFIRTGFIHRMSPSAYRRLTLRWTSTWQPITRLDTPTNSLDHNSGLSSSMRQVFV